MRDGAGRVSSASLRVLRGSAPPRLRVRLPKPTTWFRLRRAVFHPWPAFPGFIHVPALRILAVGDDAGLWHWVFALGIGFQRCGSVRGQLGDTGPEFMLVIQHIIERDDLAGVACLAAHGSY